MHAPIIDNPTLYRDMDTQHIIQTDRSVVLKHEARIKQLEKERMQSEEIASLKNELHEIKDLLKQLLPNRSPHIPTEIGSGSYTLPRDNKWQMQI